VAASGEAALDEVAEAMGQPIPTEAAALEVDSIGGFVTALAGRVPHAGERIDGPDGLVFEVVEASPRQVKQLIVHLPQPTTNAVQDE